MLCESKDKTFFSGAALEPCVRLHAYDVGADRAEIRFSWICMALRMDSAGLSSQPSKQYFRKRKQNWDWMQTDVKRETMWWGICYAFSWHSPCPPLWEVLVTWGKRGKTSTYLHLKSLEKHHAQGNLLLKGAHYLKPNTAHHAAEVAWQSCSITQLLGADKHSTAVERNPGYQHAAEVWNHYYAL